MNKTKKAKILDMFNSKEWIKQEGEEDAFKIFDYEDFNDFELNGSYEFRETYNDPIYAKSVIQKLGHRVLIGAGFHVYKDKLVLPKVVSEEERKKYGLLSYMS